MRKTIVFYVASVAVMVGAFQNCSRTNFSNSASTAGADAANGASGTTTPGGPGTGSPTDPNPPPPLDPNCGSQVKNAAGQCVDFACASVVELTAADLTSIPSRTGDGICFAYKIMSAIPVGSSTLTPDRDDEVLARSHDGATIGQTLAPYAMGTAMPQFTLLGARTVKLSGGVDATSPILVDNFVLTGVYPTGTTPDVARDFRVRGTADAGIVQGGNDTGAVLFKNVALPIEVLAGGGTASVAPIDITNRVTPKVKQTLDVRALDCGGSRQLSDIYVLFQ